MGFFKIWFWYPGERSKRKAQGRAISDLFRKEKEGNI
jgi:hypothetical protein